MQIVQRHKIVLLIIFLAAVLRLWGLSVNPPHLTSDEAALGYNAYSILKTGRDEHGKFLPVIFKSFGDWKPGLYVYLTVPFVALFGLSEWAVRLPGALAGVLAVWLVYLVVLEVSRTMGSVSLLPRPTSSITAGARRGTPSAHHPSSSSNVYIALLAAFFLAISPWHLQFSRGAWEVAFSLTLTLAGIYFFLRALRGRTRWLFLSAVFSGLTLWAYQGAKLSTSIVVFGLVLFFRQDFARLGWRNIAKGAFLGVLISLPILVSFFQGKTGRLEVYSVFSYPRPQEYTQEILDQGREKLDSWQYVFYHSEPLNFARGILGRWFNHFSGRFLFFEGDWQNARHGVPHAGVVLFLDAIFLVAGLVGLSRLGMRKGALFLWYWLVFASLPAVLSRDSVQAVRSLNMVVPLTILLALGAFYLWERRGVLKGALFPSLVVFGFVYFANYIYYLDQYWVHAPKANSEYWQYGYKQMVEKLVPLQGKYKEIVVKQSYAQPYIFFLFYQKYSPSIYQKISEDVYVPNEYGDVGLVSGIEGITFRDINWSEDRGMSGKLFVVDPIKVPVKDSSDPREFKLVDEIKYLDGRTAFRLVEIL